MTTVRKTITLTDKPDDWIKAQSEAGNCTNDSEYIRGLIRHEQERSAEVEANRQALFEGKGSGEPRPFEVSKFKQAMLALKAARIPFEPCGQARLARQQGSKTAGQFTRQQ